MNKSQINLKHLKTMKSLGKHYTVHFLMETRCMRDPRSNKRLPKVPTKPSMLCTARLPKEIAHLGSTAWFQGLKRTLGAQQNINVFFCEYVFNILFFCSVLFSIIHISLGIQRQPSEKVFDLLKTPPTTFLEGIWIWIPSDNQCIYIYNVACLVF